MGNLGHCRSMSPRRYILALLSMAGAACASPSTPAPASPPARPAPAAVAALPAETHLSNLRQLTFGGENAEAYWSSDGRCARPAGARAATTACDRIFRMPLAPDGRRRRDLPVSSGQRRDHLLVLPARRSRGASTRRRTRAGAACPPRPDHSQGYVWALYPDYDIYRASADGSGAAAAHRRRRATTPRGRFAARTARSSSPRCATATSTSTGWTPTASNVRRLTARRGLRRRRVLQRRLHADRLARLAPQAGQGAGRLQAPARAEAWCGRASSSSTSPNADGTRRPPGDVPRRRVVRARRSSRAGSGSSSRRTSAIRSGREFDLWAIDVDGHAPRADHRRARLRRLPAVLRRRQAAGLLFEPRHRAGRARHQRLRRRLEAGRAVARPRSAAPNAPPTGSCATFAGWPIPTREGRGIGTAGLDRRGRLHRGALQAAGPRARRRRRRLPAGVPGAHRPQGRARDGAALAGTPRRADAFRRSASRPTGKAAGRWCSPATASSTRSSGSTTTPASTRAARSWSSAASSPRRGAFDAPSASAAAATCARRPGSARERGARALLVVDCRLRPRTPPADWKPPAEAAAARAPRPSGYGDAGIPVLMVKRAALEPLIQSWRRSKRCMADAGGRAQLHDRARRSTSWARLPASRAAGGERRRA